MSELLDYLDNVDPWAMLAALLGLLYGLELLTSWLRERAHQYEIARTVLRSYDHGHRDGRASAIPAYRDENGATLVPPAFTRETYSS